MATTAKQVLADVRAVVAAIANMTRVNSNRKNDAPATGKYTASVLYRGEDLENFVINQSNKRIDHDMPVAIEVRTVSASDDDLLDMVYAVLDAVLLPANKPADVLSVLPDSIDEPEGTEYLSCRINITIKFRRS